MTEVPTHLESACSMTVEEALSRLQTQIAGLSKTQADERLKHFGPNRLSLLATPKVFEIFFRQFLNPLIYILLFVGGISLLLGHNSDAGFIFGVLILNAIIGGLQEYGAEKSALALRELASGRCVILRDGRKYDVDASDIVVGDIVLLESGNKIPADIRLISEKGLEVDEALLTGESLPVSKTVDIVWPENTPLAERSNMIYAGTFVFRGRASGVVTATGLRSELGQIADQVVTSVSTQTPLIIRMESFTKKLALLFAIAVILIGVTLLIRGHGFSEVLVIAVALGVAAIPEGLPVALTVALAVASRKMAKRNVIVRKLAAVEALGSCTFIASDKTGTLTINKMTASMVVPPSHAALEIEDVIHTSASDLENPPQNIAPSRWRDDFSEAVILCNEAQLLKQNEKWGGAGDSVDVALLFLGFNMGARLSEIQKKYLLQDRIVYEPELQYAAALHNHSEEQLVSVKGALERVLPMCQKMMGPNAEMPIDPAAITRQASDLASKGFRVLAVASKKLHRRLNSLEPNELHDLVFLGLIGMIDPLRAEAKSAIQSAREAGVDVAMITGDHPITAFAISRELGLVQSPDEVVTGAAIKKLDEAGLLLVLQTARVFARVEPSQKLQIVRGLTKLGHFVAVTGDGVNDAPALKAANVGVAMGEGGTDVAKETADLIISDDRFSSIVGGIEEGRIAYANVRKVIYFLISTGIGEIVLIALSLLGGLPIPLTAVQLLWLNLVTEGIQDVALAFEPKEGDELLRAPRSPKEPIFNRLMIERVTLSAIVMGGVAMIVYAWLLKSGVDQVMAQNHVLLLMVLFENVMVGNARSETKSALKMNPFKNIFLLFGVVASQGLHILAMHIPLFQKLLGTSPISFRDWFFYLILTSSMFIFIELHKLFWNRRSKGIRNELGPSQTVEVL